MSSVSGVFEPMKRIKDILILKYTKILEVLILSMRNEEREKELLS